MGIFVGDEERLVVARDGDEPRRIDGPEVERDVARVAIGARAGVAHACVVPRVGSGLRRGRPLALARRRAARRRARRSLAVEVDTTVDPLHAVIPLRTALERVGKDLFAGDRRPT
jgi:hypothetical protein